ncbi:MAG: PD40 domain-containing protein, partial [Anaerolineales bacterium]|nr:PD40 domain-containing protein [Anaerolineales bacterium]
MSKLKSILILLSSLFVMLTIACNSEEPSPAVSQPTEMATALVETETVNTTATDATEQSSETAGASTSQDSSIPVVPTSTPVAAIPPLIGNIPAVDLEQSRILFMEHNEVFQQNQLLSMKPDGSDVRLLGDNVNGTLLDWSPDGQWALVSDFQQGTIAIKTNSTQETIPLTQPSFQGSWSPDGSHIAIVVEQQLILIDFPTATQTIVPIPIAPYEGNNTLSSEDQALYNGFVRYQGVSWSPDGQWLAVQLIGINEGRQTTIGLYRYDIEPATVTALYEDARFDGQMSRIYDNFLMNFPAISPDGSVILTDAAGQGELFLIPSSGGTPASIWRGRLPILSQPQWSPTGEWIALIYKYDVYLLRPDGSEWRNITNSYFIDETEVRWSPDGRELLFVTQTNRDVYDLQRYELSTGQLTTISIDTPVSVVSSQLAADWLLLDDARLAELDQAPQMADMAPPEGFDFPESTSGTPPPPELLMEVPQQSMAPPWWRARFFHRRPLVLTRETPIEVGDPDLVQPPLIQMTLDPSLISPFLTYPESGLDIRVVWWNQTDQAWRELPFELTNLSGETALLTFPLQENLLAGTTSDQYYLYYGSQGQLQHWEDPISLNEVLIGRGIDDTANADVGVFNQLSEQEEFIEVGSAQLSEGLNGRDVLTVSASDTVAMPYDLSVGQGTFSFLINPAAQDGQLFALEGNGVTFPFIGYEEQAFQVTLLDQTFTLPAPLTQNSWHHVLITWSAEEPIQLYLDGELVSNAVYDLEYPELYSFNSFDLIFTNRLLLGATADNVGFAGQYAN